MMLGTVMTYTAHAVVYSGDRAGLILCTLDGTPVAMLSVNFPNEVIEPDEVIIDTRDRRMIALREAGLMPTVEQLVTAGVIEVPHREVEDRPVCRLVLP